MIIDAKDFAIGVLSSSDSRLSLEEKAVLYENARKFILERNNALSNTEVAKKPNVKQTINHYKNLGL